MSRILKTIHETALGLHAAGVLDDVTLREFDARCLPAIKPLSATQIRRIRKSNHASQAVFARCINASVSLVQKWETGAKQPSGPSLKLLHLVKDRGLDALL
ncbi:MAG TPA: DNA-binding transcriptional regulator [Rhodanobacteraceae bacterium]|nr:DNA-binding transcriptional regulator [Rhodanobacteraceae bacterium]